MQTFKQFIVENDNIQNVDEIVALIKRDCSTFLDFNKSSILSGSVIFRGVNPKPGDSLRSKVKFQKRAVRSDRVPKNTSPTLHHLLDEYFEKKFNFKYRTNSVFGSLDIDFASVYGDIYAIFPIGQYTILTSHKADDLYNVFDYPGDYFGDLTKLADDPNTDVVDLIADVNHNKIDKITATQKAFIYKLADKLKYFETQSLAKVSDRCELMIRCNDYYAIDKTLLTTDFLEKLFKD